MEAGTPQTGSQHASWIAQDLATDAESSLVPISSPRNQLESTARERKDSVWLLAQQAGQAVSEWLQRKPPRQTPPGATSTIPTPEYRQRIKVASFK